MSSLNILIITIVSISVFVTSVPLLCSILLPIFKPKISKNSNRYLYAFSSGFFLVIATVLFIGESKTHINEFFISHGEVVSKVITAFIVAGIIFGGLILSLGLKYLFARTKGDKELEIENHDKMIFNINDYNPKSKALAIFFVLTHRIPDAIIIGILCSEIAVNGITAVNIIFLCSFIVHMIPEELIIYYRQIDMGISRKRATINGLITTIIIVPLIIIGAVIGWFSWESELSIHIIQLVAASFLLFISIIEFLPEFLHEVKISGRAWYITMLIFIIGIAIGIFVISFHDHSSIGHEHSITNFKIVSDNLIIL